MIELLRYFLGDGVIFLILSSLGVLIYGDYQFRKGKNEEKQANKTKNEQVKNSLRDKFFKNKDFVRRLPGKFLDKFVYRKKK